MEYYAGIDVSLEASSVCVVDASGKIVKEAKVLSEPADLIAWFKALPFALASGSRWGGPRRRALLAGSVSLWSIIRSCTARYRTACYLSAGGNRQGAFGRACGAAEGTERL